MPPFSKEEDCCGVVHKPRHHRSYYQMLKGLQGWQNHMQFPPVLDYLVYLEEKIQAMETRTNVIILSRPTGTS